MFGHVHNYERTCAVYNNECKGMPQKDASGSDVYDNGNYTAPVQAVIGMAGFSLDKFPKTVVSTAVLPLMHFEKTYIYTHMHRKPFLLSTIQGNKWSLSRISEHGYVRGRATREELKMEVGNLYICSVTE